MWKFDLKAFKGPKMKILNFELEEKLDQHLELDAKLQGIWKPRFFSCWRHALCFATDIKIQDSR